MAKKSTETAGDDNGDAGRRVATIERAADVLFLFAGDRAHLGVTEIAEELSISKAVVHRILTSLRDRDLVTSDPVSRKYSLGPAVLELAARYRDNLDVRPFALEAMERLSEATNETATLSIRSGWQRIYIDQVTPPLEVKMTVKLGVHHPLHAGSSSKAFLAFLSPEEQDAFFASSELEAVTPATLTERDLAAQGAAAGSGAGLRALARRTPGGCRVGRRTDPGRRRAGRRHQRVRPPGPLRADLGTRGGAGGRRDLRDLRPPRPPPLTRPGTRDSHRSGRAGASSRPCGSLSGTMFRRCSVGDMRDLIRSAIQLPFFSLPDVEDAELFEHTASVAACADDTGYDAVFVMDHFFQLPFLGGAEQPMLEGYSLLAALAARTERVRLGTLVTGVTYRNPALLAKMLTTLDVISSGRAIAGLGAAWYAEEHAAFGYEFPPLRDRFTLLEETIEILTAMFTQPSPTVAGTVASITDAHNVPGADHPRRAAHPDRRRRGATDAAPRRAPRRGVQPQLHRRGGARQARGPARGARRRGAHTRRHQRHAAVLGGLRCRRRRCRGEAARTRGEPGHGSGCARRPVGAVDDGGEDARRRRGHRGREARRTVRARRSRRRGRACCPPMPATRRGRPRSHPRSVPPDCSTDPTGSP